MMKSLYKNIGIVIITDVVITADYRLSSFCPNGSLA